MSKGTTVQQGHAIAAQVPFIEQGPSADDVRAQLDRILSDITFQAGARRRAFLRYVVEEALSGRAARLKGYSIALAVFDRDDTFDAQSDPVVRLEARRLRRDLDCYYVDAGAHDPVRISIPKGSYIPKFEWHEIQTSIAAKNVVEGTDHSLGSTGNSVFARSKVSRFRGRKWLVAVAAVAIVAVGGAVGGWALVERNGQLTTSLRGPGVAVMPFEAYGSTENTHFLADGISQELVGNLMRFPGFRLYTFPIAQESGLQDQSSLRSELGVSYVVQGSVRDDADGIRVSAQLLEAKTGRVLWTATYDRPLEPKALIGVQSELAGEIATALGQPYGIVNQNLEAQMTPKVSDMQSYICVLSAYDYRRSFSRDAFGPALGCLEQAVLREPNYSDAWAMLGWLHLDAGRFEYAGGNDLQDQYDQAFVAATRAVELEPDNILALKALSSINHYMGRYDEAERLARRAVELNPHDPDTLAQLGWRLAVRGNFEEGIPILERAIGRTVNPPGWYFHLVAIDLYLKGKYAEMLEVARRSAADGSGVSQALIAIADAELGIAEATREALAKMKDFKPLGRDPAGYFRRHGATDEIVNALMAGLRKAEKISSRS